MNLTTRGLRVTSRLGPRGAWAALTMRAVARRLHQIHTTRYASIGAVTSHAMGGDSESALAAGCTGCIDKPIDPDTFMAGLNQFFPRTPGPTE